MSRGVIGIDFARKKPWVCCFGEFVEKVLDIYFEPSLIPVEVCFGQKLVAVSKLTFLESNF